MTNVSLIELHLSTSAFHLDDQSYLPTFCFSGSCRCRLPPLPLRPRRAPFFQGNLRQNSQINASRAWCWIAGWHNRHNCHECLRSLAWRLCRPCRKLQVCWFSNLLKIVKENTLIFGLMWSFLKTCSFRFVNVEILPPRERRRSRSRSLRRVKRRPRTIAEVMRVDYKTTWW